MNNQSKLIESYLDGELSPEKVKQVHQMIKTDPSFAAELELSEEINKAIKEDTRQNFSDNLNIIRNSLFL